MAGGSVWVTADVITNQRMNQKTLLVDTAATINGLVTTYSGQMAYATTTAAPLTLDHLYVRNNANNAWNEIAILQNANTFTGTITMSSANIVIGLNKIQTPTYQLSETNFAGTSNVQFQPITGNTQNYFVVMPSGTSTKAGYYINRVSDTTNWEILTIQSDYSVTGEFGIASIKAGTGVQRPINIYQGSTKLLSFDVANTITNYVNLIMSGASISLGGNNINTTNIGYTEGTSGINLIQNAVNTNMSLRIFSNGTARTSTFELYRLPDTSFINYERLMISSDVLAINQFEIRSQAGGTGSIRSINVYMATTKLLSFDTANTLTAYVAMLLQAKITQYNNITTAGWGVPAIYGQGRTVGATGSVASVATYTVGASDGSFEVSGVINVTAISGTPDLQLQATYTDETNTGRTLVFQLQSLSSGWVRDIQIGNGVGVYSSPVLHIRCKASTAITIVASLSSTAITYNVEGIIKQTA